MLNKVSIIFNNIFKYFCPTDINIIGSAGILLVKDFILQLKIVELFKTIPDNRNPIRILYSLPEELIGIILRILDGENRLSYQQGDKNSSLYQKLYNVKKEPHFTTQI